jgi:hypothetical protein
MLLDAAKGLEPQTRKLFEVCRMRSLPLCEWGHNLLLRDFSTNGIQHIPIIIFPADDAPLPLRICNDV